MELPALDLLNQVIQYWIISPWYISFLLSLLINISVFIVTALAIDNLSTLAVNRGIGKYLNTRELKPNQKKIEIKNGLFACIIFSAVSLIAKYLFKNIWPESLADLLIQATAFIIFYETYSYLIHRLLHKGIMRRVHAVHHRSIRVTPWSAYSVHPIEALIIAASAQIFMAIFPLSLGTVLVLHISGMMFTITIHSNFTFNTRVFPLSIIGKYAQYHLLHHTVGDVNFGFINRFYDQSFGTVGDTEVGHKDVHKE